MVKEVVSRHYPERNEEHDNIIAFSTRLSGFSHCRSDSFGHGWYLVLSAEEIQVHESDSLVLGFTHDVG